MANKAKKVIGNLMISEASIQPCFSFLDFKIHRGVNIVPIIAVDYSLSNLTFDDQKCIHSLKKGANNDYLTVIEHITNAYKNISSYMLGLGMGARTIPKKGETSDCFSLTGNIFNPIVDIKDLRDNYAATLKRVELSLPVNYHTVLEHASDYAKYEVENHEARNYYVLIYVSVGVIDDFQETLEVLKEISDLPLSVTMVRVRNMQMEDTNDPALLIKECAMSFAACERQYLDIIDFEDFKKEGNLGLFEAELVRKIPLHVQKYMEIHNVFAYDIDATDYASRMSIAYKKQQVATSEGMGYSEEVARRQSMVNIKDFIKDIREQEYADRKITEDTIETNESKEANKRSTGKTDFGKYILSSLDIDLEDEDEDEESVVVEEHKVKEILEESDSDEEEHILTWYSKVKRPSFSELMQERFILSLPEDPDMPKDKCKKLIEEGKLIEENEDNVRYLLKQETALEQNTS